MDKHDQKVLFSRDSDEWSTPQWLYDKLDQIHSFTLDPCSTATNAKCKKFYTLGDDGLSKSWHEERVFVNPPFSNMYKWVEKCYNEAKKNMAHVVLLIPSRTDTKYFNNFVMKANKITFIKGRLKFGGSKNSAPFPSMIVEFFPYSNGAGTPSIDTMNNK